MGGRGSGRRRTPPSTRFWAKVRTHQHEDSCWTWKSGTSIPSFWDGRSRVAAHRWAWEHANGPVPEGHSVVRRCRNRRCVRPTHMYLRVTT